MLGTLQRLFARPDVLKVGHAWDGDLAALRRAFAPTPACFDQTRSLVDLTSAHNACSAVLSPGLASRTGSNLGLNQKEMRFCLCVCMCGYWMCCHVCGSSSCVSSFLIIFYFFFLYGYLHARAFCHAHILSLPHRCFKSKNTLR